MARWDRLAIWACLFLCLQLTVGAALIPIKRQDNEPSTAATTPAVRTGTVRGGGSTASSAVSARPTSATVTVAVSSSLISSSPSATPTMTEGGSSLDNSSLFNTTVPEGQLPLEPKITPGWAVAGVILLGVGVAYTLIGIRQPLMHNTLSVAYVIGVGITVLVVYLMPLPVTNSSQGGYVAAAILPGVAVGVLASLFFNEITECFVCALGGFCLSMWLLCLQEGGLLSGTSKVIFIVVLTFASFAAYFTRWTRDWALIVTISFTGATSTVIGIDCFSRAGLKEFWAYIWHLNDNLFPLGTHTYPLTKGIRVELAAIIVIFCVGVISQKRLWNVVKDHRSKRQQDLAEERRIRDEEELKIGKQIEAETARERRAWERVHGDHDSGFGRDSESEKADQYAQSPSTPGPQSLMVAEMQGSDVPPAVPPKTASQVFTAAEKEKGSMVTVQAVPEEAGTGVAATLDEAPGLQQARQATDPIGEATQKPVVSPAPEVVPLPFTFPVLDDNNPRARASTVATFADDDDDQMDIVSKRSSIAKRISQSSVSLMRRVSQRTSISRLETQADNEKLAVLHQRKQDENGSIAATIDSENDSGASTVQVEEARRRDIEVKAQLAQKNANERPATATSESTSLLEKAVNGTDSKHTSNADTLANDVSARQSSSDATAEDAAQRKTKDGGDAVTEHKETLQTEQPAAPSQKAKSTASADSMPVSLTRERLPPELSNIALHYRTNEWAKHLSHAEAPVPEMLPVTDFPEDKPARKEVPAPLNVEELKQTALNATPAPMPTPSTAAPASTPSPGPIPSPSPIATPVSNPLARPMSNYVPVRGHSRNNSWSSAPGVEAPAAPSAVIRPPQPVHRHHRRISSKNQVPTVQTIAEESIHEPSRADSTKSGSSEHVSAGPSPIVPANFERPPPPPGVMSYDSPQSLLAQRSVALRNKTYGILTGANTTPEFAAAPRRISSESASMYNYSYPQQAQASLDDLPLSQRKEIIRRQTSQTSLGNARNSFTDLRSVSSPYMSNNMSAENIAFDSHQPMRHSNAPSQEAREARLASFRNSVRADLRSGMAVAPAGANGRDQSMLYRASSSSNIAAQATAREADMQRNIDLQRSFLMSQKEAEAKRRERERMEKERANQAFTRSMQTGEMFDLHRDAMRRMQQGAKNA
ncbi:hypothetical protein CMUS01_02231 [Colletotrichum musicola]|uniref:TM7S3/TM198-like domain-containing protein n=1 Tax=Colletotrichum musicola TaxID=2175873 RepID=A0A8H6NVH8_9PEZI|nr:hypothetical protein CMUS01_02231 [Colletotrichum musicola]